MLRESVQPDKSSLLADSHSVYGWVSILLHWLTAIVIIALWILGKSILNAGPEEMDSRRALHVSIATSAWLVVLFRIIWRFRSGHPKVRGLAVRTHSIAKTAHYLMLLLLILMLLSGPVMVWAGGHSVSMFGIVSIPGPFGASQALRDLAWTVHSQAAVALLLLVIVHIGGALKHLMFHSDDTIVRMLWPVRQDNNETTE